MSESHDHDHDGHDHDHPGLRPDELLSERAKRALAIHELLVEKGIAGPDEIQEYIAMRFARNAADGARVVAHAWTDAAFKARLLADPKAALDGVGYELGQQADLHVVENVEGVRHLVVCTLCSCYPTMLLGPPPDWYKSFAYRSRAIVEPRAVMREFGAAVSDDTEVRVLDSTADVRYMVIPQRPAGTEGFDEEELATLVTRDSMVGVSDPLSPTRTTSKT